MPDYPFNNYRQFPQNNLPNSGDCLTGTGLSSLLLTYLRNDASLSASDLLLLLNLGQKRIIRDAPYILRQKSGTLSLVNPTREYSLASDFYMMTGIYLQSTGKKIEAVLANEWLETVERLPTIPSGPPTQYTILGFDESQGSPAWRIIFNYIPSSDLTVTYWYRQMPSDITADSIPVISSMGFDELLLWASALVGLEPRDPAGANNARMFYAENLASFREYRPMAMDYKPTLRSDYPIGGSTLRLPTEFPAG